MGWLLIYMISLYALWHAIDMEANSVFENAIAPFAFALVLIAFLIWLRSKVGGGSSSSNGGVGGSCGGGGDGGGGC